MDSDALGAGTRLAGGPTDALAASAFSAELLAAETLHPWMYFSDMAHVAALHRGRYVSKSTALTLADGLRTLKGMHFSEISWDPYLGDVYNNRDVILRKEVGEVDAGFLSTGRSRRESMTVAWSLATRDGVASLYRSVQAAASAIVSTAEEHVTTVTVDQTYLQHAHPTTLGHYLLGFASPLIRSLQRLSSIIETLDSCPAGVGSVNGSRLDLGREFQSELLGWSRPFAHVRDAMWAPDIPVSVASEVVNSLTAVDRLAEELLIWSTAEYGLLELNDGHSRASVVMPQKKNPYGLAYLRGLCRRSLGELTGLAASQLSVSGQPDSRMLAYESLVPSLHRAANGLDLFAEILMRSSFDVEKMAALAEDPLVAATDVCDFVSVEYGVPNRLVHKVVGSSVRHALESDPGRALTAEALAEAAERLSVPWPKVDEDALGKARSLSGILGSRGGDGEAAPEAVKRLCVEYRERLGTEPATLSRWENAIQNFDRRISELMENSDVV